MAESVRFQIYTNGEKCNINHKFPNIEYIEPLLCCITFSSFFSLLLLFYNIEKLFRSKENVLRQRIIDLRRETRNFHGKFFLASVLSTERQIFVHATLCEDSNRTESRSSLFSGRMKKILFSLHPNGA